MNDVLKKIAYVFDTKTKVKLFFLLMMIIIGAMLELLGVSIILPLIDAAMVENGITQNRFCILISNATGLSEDKEILLIVIIIMLLIYIVKNIYMSWMNSVLYTFSGNMHRSIANRLIKTYFSQPYSFFLKKNTAELIRSVNVDTIGFYHTVYNCLLVLSSGLTAGCMLAYLFYTNGSITIVLLLVLAFFALTVFKRLQKKTRELGIRKQKMEASILQTLQQAFQGAKEIKVFHKEEYFIDEFEQRYKNNVAITRESNLLAGLPKYLIETISISVILIMLAMGIMYGGESSQQLLMQLSVFAVAAFRLLPSVNAIYAYMNTIMYNRASLDLVYHDLKESEILSCNQRKNESKERLEFYDKVSMEHISFHYDNAENMVLKDTSLVIRKGESIAFIGPSGGGKTTAADIFLGLLTPTEGEICVDGHNIQDNYSSWLKLIGYIPQVIFLYDDSIRKNIAFGIEENNIDDGQIWKALEEAQLDEFVRGLPEGLETSVGERGVRLSGGQRQRIGIARALYNNPEILVLDEATSALDNETEKEVMDAIGRLHGRKTMIIIAHRLSTIEQCDHVYRIEEGKILECKKL